MRANSANEISARKKSRKFHGTNFSVKRNVQFLQTNFSVKKMRANFADEFQREKKSCNFCNRISAWKKRRKFREQNFSVKKNGVDCNFYDYNETLRGVLCFIIIIKIFRARLEKIGAEND